MEKNINPNLISTKKFKSKDPLPNSSRGGVDQQKTHDNATVTPLRQKMTLFSGEAFVHLKGVGVDPVQRGVGTMGLGLQTRVHALTKGHHPPPAPPPILALKGAQLLTSRVALGQKQVQTCCVPSSKKVVQTKRALCESFP